MLEQVEELRELARTLNFNTTAQLLHMSQSTLTRHVAGLEGKLGFRLFERTPMRLTQAGRYYIASVGKLYDEYLQVVEQCTHIATRSKESVCMNVVAATHSQWGDIFYEAITLMQERYPEIPEAHFCLQRGMTIEASVLSGVADVGIVFRKPEELPDGFTCLQIAEFPLAAYFNDTSPLAKLDQVSFDDLADYYLVCPSSPQLQTTFDGAVDAMRRNGVEPRYRIRNFSDFDRVHYLMADDEFVFGNDIPGMTDPTNALTSAVMVGKHNTYPVYLLFNTNSNKIATALFVDICLEIASARFPIM